MTFTDLRAEYHAERAKSARFRYDLNRFFFWFNVVMVALNLAAGLFQLATGGPPLNLIVAAVCVFGAIHARDYMREARRLAEFHEGQVAR